MSAPASKPEMRVLYNGECPVCALEIGHYRRTAAKRGLPVRFDDLNGPDRAAWGLDADAAARRLHVMHEGRVVSGLPAFRLLWASMPGFGWLARLTDLPGMRQASGWAYDRLGAPLLYRMHLRRTARRG